MRTASNGKLSGGERARSFRWMRDGILLLMIAGITVVTLTLGSTRLADRYYHEQRVGNCLSLDSASNTMHGIPNCSFREKIPETDWVQYHFNECGDRTPIHCNANASNAFRIVMVGSSVAMGYRVEQSKTMAAVLPQELSRSLERPVEVYDTGINFGTPAALERNFNKALDRHPRMILWVLSPWDMENASLLVGEKMKLQSQPASGKLERILGMAKTYSFSDLIQMGLHENPVMKVLRMYVYREATPTAYVNLYLKGSEKETGFLKANLSPVWNEDMTDFFSAYTQISAAAHAAHIPLVITMVPYRAQAIMISSGYVPTGYDPYLLDRKIKNMVTSQGDIFLDILPMYKDVQRPDLGYLPVDGHPTALGQATFSRMVADQLIQTNLIQSTQSPDSSHGLTEGK